MAKNITIYPSNSTQLPNRIPHIDYIGTGNNNILSISVLGTAALAFSGNSASPYPISIYVDPTNSLISGDTLNVKDYFSVGGTQVINATANWIGPTTNIEGAQGAQGAQGSQGPQGAQGISPGSKGDFGTQGEKGNQLDGGFFEWNDTIQKLLFKPYGWTGGDKLFIVELYRSGSY